MTSRTCGNATRTFNWDFDNRLTRVQENGVTLAEFGYDYAGQRVKKTTGGNTTLYIGKHYECTGSICSKFIFAGRERVAMKPVSASVTVTKSGTGAGTVTSSPSGISCGATCSALFASDVSVTLTASATGGSTFAGFSGGCTSVTTTCTFTVTADATVTATFNDTQAPTISNVAASSITSGGATITWTTNEASDTQVEYGTTTSYGSSTTLNTAMVTSHSATLSGLSPSTLYNYRVKSRDAAGNLATSGNFTFTTTSSSGGPDLSMLSVGATPSDSNLTINDAVRNIGTVNAGAFNVGFYLSTDNTYQGTDTFLCQRSVSGLAAGANNPASGTATTTCSISTVTPGLYYVIGRADSGLAVAETNEGNNTWPSSQIVIGPDLIISLINASKASNTLTIQSAIKNQGTAAAAASEISFYLSTDQTLNTANDTFVCKRSVTSLAAGASDPASSATTTTCTIPSVPAGGYYVIGFADSAGVVTEARENNNTQTGAFITVP